MANPSIQAILLSSLLAAAVYTIMEIIAAPISILSVKSLRAPSKSSQNVSVGGISRLLC